MTIAISHIPGIIGNGGYMCDDGGRGIGIGDMA